jgi:uridylate kinase
MNTVVISLGGSMIVQDEVNYKFLKQIKKVLLKHNDKKFVVCTGGGKLAREYMKPLKKEGLSEYQQDLMGIEATRLNAYLVAAFIGEKSNKEIPKTLEEVADAMKGNDVVVCGGLTPGQTSDGTTAMIANYLDADVMINMTNVDGLFDKDPDKHEDAKLIPEISHQKFKEMLSKIKKKPGMHFVLDHLAAEVARKANMKVIIIKGANNLDNVLNRKKFKGTVIS